MTEELKIQTTIDLLEKELVGTSFPDVESLYNFNYENNTMLYKPEVFERYVEIYNSLTND
jgi:hypothetical protein